MFPIGCDDFSTSKRSFSAAIWPLMEFRTIAATCFPIENTFPIDLRLLEHSIHRLPPCSGSIPGTILFSNLLKGAFCLERTYFLDIASLRVHLFLIISDDLPNYREGVFECQNMKVKLLAVILKPISTLSV